jgi:L-fuconolactonase
MIRPPAPEPAPSLPARVIDPHMHQWNPFTTPRHSSGRAKLLRPLPRIPPAFGRLASRADREFVGDPHHVMKPYLPQHYLRDCGQVSVDAVVHIEAAWVGDAPLSSVEETRWVAGLPFGKNGAPELGGIVVHADPRWDDIGVVLDTHLAASPLVRGVRHSLSHHAGDVRNFEDRPDVVADPDFIRGFAAIAERGLTFELWLYSHQLSLVHTLLSEYPETTFVLDHYATPVGLFGPRGGTGSATQRRTMLDRWHEDIAEVAGHPNVVAKHSGLGMPLLGDTPRRQLGETSLSHVTDRAAALIRHLHDCFGPDRTMWASNYPMDKPVLSLPATAQVLLDVLGHDAEPQRLFHDNAARVYRLETGPQGSRSTND